MDSKRRTVSHSNCQTVAQALRRVKRLKGEHALFTQRARESVHWVEERRPVFNFKEVLGKREQATEELIGLKAAIARANTNTSAGFEGKTRTIQELVFLMAELKDQVAFYTGLPVRQGAEEVEKVRQVEYDEELQKRIVRVEEVHHHCELTELERAQRVDELRHRIDALNDLLESLNHTTKL